MKTCNSLYRWNTIQLVWSQPKHTLHCARGISERCRVQWLYTRKLIHHSQNPSWFCHSFD